MPCVSDTGATAPISALTSASSLSLNRGRKTDDFGFRFVDPATGAAVVKPFDSTSAAGSKRQRFHVGTPCRSACQGQRLTNPHSVSVTAGASWRGPPATVVKPFDSTSAPGSKHQGLHVGTAVAAPVRVSG